MCNLRTIVNGVRLRIFLALLFFPLLFTPPALQSSQVSNVRYTTIESDFVRLDWDDAEGGCCYQVVLSTVAGFAINLSSGLSEVNLRTTHYFNLEPNTSHTFLVKPSSQSDTTYISTSTFTAWPAPGVNSFQTFATSVTVNMVHSNAPAGTLFRVQASSNNFFTIDSSSEGVSSTLTVTGLLGNTSYQITAQSLNDIFLGSTRTLVTTLLTTPTAPTFQTFTSSDVSASSVTARWLRNGNSLTPQTSYQLQIATSSDFGGAIRSSVTFDLEATDIGLSPGTSYYFRVRAFGFGPDISSFSPVTSTFTRAASPTLDWIQVFTTSMTVNLGENGNPAGTNYTVQATSDGFITTFSSSAPNDPGGAAPTLTLLNLPANTTYQISAFATGFNKLVSTTSVLSATSTLAEIPAPVFQGVSGTSITISWFSSVNPLNPPTSYQVQISTWDGFLGTVTSSITFNQQVSTAGLKINTSYYFRARVFHRGGGVSAYNNTVSTLTGFNSPSVISFSMFATSATAVLSRNGNPVGTSFAISTGNFTFENSSAGAADVGFTTLSITNLTPNTFYMLLARSFNITASSNAVAALSTFTLAAVPILNSFQTAATSVTVSLGANGNPIGTVLVLSTGADGRYAGSDTVSTFVTAANTSVTLDGINGNTLYAFQAGTRGQSPAASTQTTIVTVSTITLAAQPTFFFTNQGDVGISSISITWLNVNSLTPPTSYQVQISTSNDFIGAVTSSETFVAGVSTAGLNLNTTYYFRARAFGRGNDMTEFSPTFSTATLGISPGFNGFEVFGTSVTIYPVSSGNPPGSLFRLQISTDSFATVTSSTEGLSSSLTADGLTANTTYQLSLDIISFTGSLSSRTIVATTATLPVEPGPFITFTALTVSSTSILVDWDPSNNTLIPSTSFQIVISTDINFNVSSDTDTFFSSATFSSLTPNTSYYFRAKAYGRGTLDSPFNTPVATHTHPAVPVIDSFSIFSTSITIHLSTGGNAPGVQYFFQASTDDFASIFDTHLGPDASTDTIGPLNGILPSLTISSLTANRQYKLRTVATGKTNISVFDEFITTWTLPTVPSSHLVVENHWPSLISVRWSSNRNSLFSGAPTTYEHEIATSSDFSTIVQLTSATFTSNLPEAIFTLGVDLFGLDLDTTFYSRVRAKGQNGIDSGYSVAVTTLSGMNAPGQASPGGNFRIFATSATASLTLNGNPVGTQFELCALRKTNDASDELSSSYVEDVCVTSAAAAGITNMVIPSGLFPDQTYKIVAKARILTLSSGTEVTVSTVSLSLPPRTLGFQISSDTLDASVYSHVNFPVSNRQPSIDVNGDIIAGTTLAISTGMNGHFNVALSSIGQTGSFSESTQTFRITGLSGNTTYSFQAVTQNKSPSAGIGGKSQISIITLSTVTLAVIPGANLLLSTDIGSSSMTLTWGNNSNSLSPPTSYQVQISTWQGFAGTITSSETFNIFATTSNLLPNREYFFRVRAFGRSANDVTVYNSSISAFTRPNTPGLITSDVHPTSVTIHLSNNLNPVGTPFLLSASTDGFNTLSATNQGSCRGPVTLMSLRNLSGNTTYSIALEALNFDGLASSRTIVRQQIQTDAVIPGTPTVTPSDVQSSSITARWDPKGNALPPLTTYQLQISTGPSFIGAATSSQTLDLFATTSTLLPNTQYFFRVRALGNSGNVTEYSDVLSTVTRANAPSHSGFQVSRTSIVVQLSNNRNPVGTSYQLTASTDGFVTPFISTSGITQGSGITLGLASLLPNTTYEVRAESLNFNGLVSSTTLVASTSTNAEIPVSLSILSVDGTSATVTWQPNGNPLVPPTSYQVQVSTWNGFIGTVTSSVTFLLQASTSGLLLDTSYYFRVRAFDRRGATTGFTAIVSTLTGSVAPGLVSFQVFATSVTVVMDPNGNAPTTLISVSSGNFSASNSSAGAAGVGFTTLTVSNLTPNTSYTFNAISQSVTFSSLTFIASTTTLAISPTLSSFQLFATSASFNMNSNGNPDGTSLMISTGSDGNFGVSLSSISITTSSVTQLVVSGLLGNTTYAFQAGTRDSTAGASTKTVSISLSTITLAAMPTAFILTGGDIGISSISLSWVNFNSLSPPTSYQMQIATDSSFTGAVTSSETFVVRVTSSDLFFNTTYHFRVRAFGRGGDITAYSSSIATATLAVSPGILGFQVFTNTGTVFLTGNQNPANTIFRIDVSSDGFSSVAFSSQGVPSTLTVEGLGANTTYQIGATAVNFNQLDSSRTLIASTVTLAATPGTVSFSEVNETSVTVSWQTNGNSLTPPTSYQVQIATSSDFVQATTSITFVTQSSLTSLNPSATYFVRVAAFGKGGDTSNFAATISTETEPIPLTVAGFQIFSSSISVTLDAGANPAGITLAVTTGSFEAAASSSALFSSGNVNLLMSNLVPNSIHTIQTRATSINGNPGEITVVATTATIPAAPASPTFGFVGQSSGTISWGNNGNPLTPPTSYQVQFSSGQVADFSSFSSSETFALSAEATDLDTSTTYFFRVIAHGIGGTNNNSVTISTITDALTPPTTPQGFVHGNISVTSMTFTWPDSDNETGYKIFSDTGPLLGTVSQNTTSFVLTGLSPNHLISARLAAFNNAGTSTSSVVLSSYTLSNVPGAMSIVSANLTQVDVAWGVNGNPSNTTYELVQSTDFFASSTTLISFASNVTVSSETVTGLVTGNTYGFRARASNLDNVFTDYNSSITLSIINSDGSSLSVGDTTVDLDPGVTVLTALLSNGRTMQIYTSSISAQVTYGNGIAFTLLPNTLVTAFASADDLVLTSTRATSLTAGTYGITLSSGTTTIGLSETLLSCNVSTSNAQDITVSQTVDATRTLEIFLNPASGAIRIAVGPGTFSELTSVRFHLPDSFPSNSLAAPGSSIQGAASFITGTDIGVEITTDKLLQPLRPVSIQMSYRDSDLGGAKPEQLTISRFDDSVQKWLSLATNLDSRNRTTDAIIQHFSTFQLMVNSPASDVNQLRVFPNPLAFHAGDTEMIFTNISAQASVKIYTYSGELVRELSGGDSGIVRWDGRNQGGNKVATGVYIALVEGAQDSRKIIKIAVEK